VAIYCYYIARREMATIFSIQVSAVSKGASISHLSQFPGEEELLMPPGSFLEVAGVPPGVAFGGGRGGGERERESKRVY